ncbi:hypothetical protein SUGI_0690520 [Cryptomeria japonica]|uniref:ATP-dependent DNA helicase PIF1 n=1 Tax=Cryptomeria japonica TaxID=3369 RepID=UPI002414B0AF|nr:ATP-dependent DNA helicase PIF1 [Cryptomeria japonica]GLJ34341.1 hypothetical protein SUGI_0690520 [Cryptomeria japonica]
MANSSESQTHRYNTRYRQRQQEQLAGTAQENLQNLRLTQQEEEENSIQLSEEQANVLSIISEGRSVFFTGAAGTGKTFLLRRAITNLKRLHGNEFVFVTASTGMAAAALNGTTLHSFAGIGCASESAEGLLSTLYKMRDAKLRWQTAKALVIDEINMIHGELFEKLNYIAKKLRKQPDLEFGGLQLVVSGDFFQLCPVDVPNFHKFFAFQADCWDTCFEIQTELTEIYRQSDLEFKLMLNEIRRGICSDQSVEMLRARQGLRNEEGLTYTKLYFLKVDAERENKHRLKEMEALGTEMFTFHAQDEDNGSEPVKSQINKLIAVKKLKLCVEAEVMLIYNLDTKRGLVNGTKGRVLGFQHTNENPDISPGNVWPVVQFEGVNSPVHTVTPRSWDVFDENGNVIAGAKRIQVPLISAWALSAYKCQGLTLERVETDLSTFCSYGLVYLVLSRLKTLEGLRLTGFHPSAVKVHPAVFEFYEKLGRNGIE